MLTLYYHPLSSFCIKVLAALYEAGLPFEPRLINLGKPEDRATLTALWPMSKFPVLHDAVRGRTVAESSIIIEYLCQHWPAAAPLLPAEPGACLDVRLWDRIFDTHVHYPMQKVTADARRPADGHDAIGVAEARATLAAAYGLLEQHLAHGQAWITGAHFTLADCAAAPALFYGVAAQAPTAQQPRVWAYLERLLARPSVARTLAEAQPWLQYFPLADALPPRYRPGA